MKNKLASIILFLLIHSCIVYSQNKIVYEFPVEVQNRMRDRIDMQIENDTSNIKFLMLSTINNIDMLSYYSISKNYNDSLISSIRETAFFANVCGKQYPLLFFYDFLYSKKLNYINVKNKLFITNVNLPHSKFDLKFKGQAYQKGEIIKP